MPVTEIGDPRLKALFGAEDPRAPGVRPTVRLPGKGIPPIIATALIVLAAVLLFAWLNARRTAPAEPTVRGRASELGAGAWATPPPLYIPPAPTPVIVAPVIEPKPATTVIPVPSPIPAQRTAPPQPVYLPQPAMQMAPPSPVAPPRASAGAALVIDSGNTQGEAGHSDGVPADFGMGATRPAGRMRASALANRSMTVPQGYLIPAVLETGFDSTKPGFARAVVSRDVRGFDGANVLIPRGSRLIGAYKSTAARGENRAIITWTRLMRPDGMTIAMDAPSVDTVGRGGIPASVNSHFFGRLGDALLQTTMDLGRTFAGRSVPGVVVVPGATGAAASPLSTGRAYEPTLTVRPGTSISVFVAHDLDFSAAGSAR